MKRMRKIVQMSLHGGIPCNSLSLYDLMHSVHFADCWMTSWMHLAWGHTEYYTYFVHGARCKIGVSLITAPFPSTTFPVRLVIFISSPSNFCKALALWRRFKAHRQSKLTVLFQHEPETGSGTYDGTSDYVTFCDYLWLAPWKLSRRSSFTA
jgi:hypothetical protein